MLTFDKTITLTATTSDACNRGDNSDQVCLVRTAGVLRIFDIGTGTQVGSDVSVVSGSRNLCTVNLGASACVFSTTQTTMSWVELPNGYVTTPTGGATAGNGTGKGQMTASNSAGIALCAGTASNSLVKFNSTTGVLSTLTIDYIGNATGIKSLIAYENNRFLIGTNAGCIYEIDSNGICYGSVVLNVPQSDNNDRNTVFPNQIVNGLSYYDGSVLAVTSYGLLYRINWPTRTIEYVDQVFLQNDNTAPICAASGGTVILGEFLASGVNTLRELDFTVTPYDVRSTMFTNTAVGMVACGILNSRAWAVLTDMTVMGITQRTISSRNVSINDPGLEAGRMISLINNGAGQMQVELDCGLPDSAQTLPVTPGKTIYEVVLKGRGVNEKSSVSKYTT